jgi:DNA-binding NarL/FixJ family response regulator
MPRERQLRALLLDAHAYSIKAIAFKLGLVEGTVKVYAAHLYAKLGVSGRIELATREIADLRQQLHGSAGAD